MQAAKSIWDLGCVLKQLAHAEFHAAMATPPAVSKLSLNPDPQCPHGL